MKINPLSKKDWILIKRSLVYVKPYKIKFILTFMCIVSSIGFGLAIPALWAKIIASIFLKDYQIIIAYTAITFCIHILEMAVNSLQSYLFASLNENIIYDIKRDMYDRIINLPVKAFDEVKTGEFISRLNGDAATISNIITTLFLSSTVDVLRVIIIGIVVFSISVPMAVIVLATFPISFLILKFFGKRLREKSKEVAGLNDNLFSSIQESIAGIREIKSLGIKNDKFKSFLNLGRDLKEKNIKMGILNAFSNTFAQGVTFVSQIAVLGTGCYLIFRGLLKVEHFIAFDSYSHQFSGSLRNLSRLNANIQQSLTSLERIFSIIDSLNYSQERFGDKNINKVIGDIELNNIHFEYNENTPVLKGVSLRVPCNGKTAIVGVSGGGKTTILNLLMRFYDPSLGNILIDNIDIKEFDEQSLRKHISIVRQEPFLFNTTIRDNLLFAAPSATQEEIESACKAAYIHDYIQSLPDKYNSIVGNNGVNFSGGQKQRIAIARAILKNSKIILFDEATSSLDNESQYCIKSAIDQLAKDHTIIIIAHRLLTIVEADEIIVIEKGEIVGRGQHKHLIEKNETYIRLYKAELDIMKQNYVIA
ncbi:MAG: ABC transporter ATP-binding protein/permease [Clostridia bacterium]|nr:ABC transporter ATP-binding protein/permease [Clostridia bacterium]